jgi:ATP synthase A1 C subunit
MRSRLLTPTDYSQLLSKADVDEIITYLSETPYKKEIETSLLRFSGVGCVFEAVHLNLTRTLLKVREFFQGEPRFLLEILLRRWDRHNLLTILRGQTRKSPPEAVLTAIVPVGQLDQVALRELARQPDVRAVIDLMSTWQLPYASALRQVRVRTGGVSDLEALEVALSRSHYQSIRDQLQDGNNNRHRVLIHIKTEVDIINLSIAFRFARRSEVAGLQAGSVPEDFRSHFIQPGGFLDVDRITELLTGMGSVPTLVEGLRHSRYLQALESGLNRYRADEGGVAVLERELERWKTERAAAMFTQDGLSIGIAIGYFGCKEMEIANLRLIAQGVVSGLDREQIRHDLIIVGDGTDRMGITSRKAKAS